VVVETPNSVAAPTTVPQPKVPISRDAVVTPANTVVVRMVPPKQAVTTSKVAKISHRIFKRVVFSRKSAVPVAITRSNGSSTWTTAAVPGSGTADATETTIVSRPKKNATASVLNRREWVMGPRCSVVNLLIDFSADRCKLPKVSGPCEGYYPQWYYDTERKHCAQFIYGGCLGNNNRFETREDCMSLCVKDSSVGNGSVIYDGLFI
jgi:hypothetical protein